MKSSLAFSLTSSMLMTDQWPTEEQYKRQPMNIDEFMEAMRLTLIDISEVLIKCLDKCDIYFCDIVRLYSDIGCHISKLFL